MNTPWTPGPWAVDTIHENGFYLQDRSGYELHDGRTEANRRLIAAAPEMAGVLQLLLTAYNHPSGDFGEDECDEAADKAAEIFTRIRGEA